jgi:hypothetical protein
MRNTITFFRSVVLVAWTAAGHGGCASAGDVRDPDIAGCPVRAYRVAAVEVPISAAAAYEVGFDLDGDGVRDNWLGFANMLLHAWSPAWDLAPAIEARLADDVEWTLELGNCADGTATAWLGDPAAPDGEVARGPGAPGSAALAGGTFAVPLGALGDVLGGAPVGWTAAPLAQVRIESLDAGGVRATLGLAITRDDLIDAVAPSLAAYFTERLAVDDSDFAAAADLDADGVITVEELLASATARVLLAPDLDRAEVAGAGFSLGIRLEAVP